MAGICIVLMHAIKECNNLCKLCNHGVCLQASHVCLLNGELLEVYIVIGLDLSHFPELSTDDSGWADKSTQ